MNVLVTGADGFIGSRLMRYLLKDNRDSVITGFDINISPWNHNLPIVTCNLIDASAVNSLLESYKPDTIVLNGAVKGLEQCQNNLYSTSLVNVFSLKPFVLYAIQNPSVHLIFISSDMVFGNCLQSLYDEDYSPQATNAYGQMKIIGEELVKLTTRWTIVRTALVYGSLYHAERQSLQEQLLQESLENQSLLIHWCSERTLQGKPVLLADNVFCTPTYINNLSASLAKIIWHKKTGIFHCSGNNRISRYNLGLLAASIRGNPHLIQSFSSDRTALRPLDVSLDNQKTNRELDIEPISITDGVKTALLHEDFP